MGVRGGLWEAPGARAEEEPGRGGWPRGWLAAEGREEPSVRERFGGCRLPLVHAPTQQGLGRLIHFQVR